MWKPMRCFFRPSEIRDLSSDSSMDISTPAATQADTTTTKGKENNPPLEATASPYQSTFRLIKMTPVSQSLAAEPAGSLLTTTLRDTADTTSETNVEEFTDQLSWKPSPPAAPKIPVADPVTLRTLLGLAQLLQDAKATPALKSSARHTMLSNNMKRSRSPSSGPVSRTRPRVETASEARSEDEDEAPCGDQVQSESEHVALFLNMPSYTRSGAERVKRRHEGELDEEPESPMPMRRKIKTTGAVEECLGRTMTIDLRQNSPHALAEDIGKMEVPPSTSPLRRRLQLWEKYVIEQYEQAEGEIDDNLQQLMSAVVDSIRDICIDEDEDEE
ncbi:hypothetical protein EW145_g3701 [Phellinidium pouzarii]|uniref:Uncharacterized protein n=1 Tax=Phellinidium pouzarii TaxID=167371 RepID=A0A4S4L7P4_9AGAM|nr:hypothetical protein EW145_g3701 [Phellinidium pouzarii]